jgi:phage replication O-like protein O
MASPQCENGFFKIANELAEALSKTRLAGQECQVLWAVMRKTYGYGKKHDRISCSQISGMTGLDRRRIQKIINDLHQKKILSVTNNGVRKPLTIGINKNYESWRSVTKNGVRSSTSNGNNCKAKDSDTNNGVKNSDTNNGVKSDTNNGVKSDTNNGAHKRQKDRKTIPSDFLEFSKRFHAYQQEQLGGKLVKVTDKKIRDGAETVEKLVRLDGYDLQDDIRPALLWAVDDHFWSTQVRSLAGLRRKMGNGEIMFSNLLASWHRSKPKQKVVEQVW